MEHRRARPDKRILADRLIRRLRERFAPGGMLHYGQGKWYPGEPLPRWAFSLFWRKDGKPVWQNADLIAAPARNAAPIERGCAPVHRRPGRATRHHARACAAGFEDPAERMLKEGALPANIDPSRSAIDDAA